MKLNKVETTKNIIALGDAIPCTKLELQNIVFPKWSDLGLMGLMFRQCVTSKEQPTGNIYDEAVFQTVLRVIGGKVLMSGRPDCYCWKFDKLQKAKNVKNIGVNSAAGLITLSEVLTGIPNQEDKSMLADMFSKMKEDLLLVTSPAEQRMCIEVTPKLYAAGVTHCVDEWMKVDENGNAEATVLCVGDYLILSENGVYRIGHDEFVETHVLV